MFKVILVTHGTLSLSFISTAELIVGKLDNVECYSVLPNTDLSEIKNLIFQSISWSNEHSEKVLVFTDLMFGTPFNIMLELLENCTFGHITGVNLPVILEVMVARSTQTYEEILQTAKKIGESSIINFNDYMERIKEKL